MRILKGIVISAAFAVLITVLVPAAKADQGDWSTLVTFSKPMQVGKIVLTPGTYVLQVADIWAPACVMIYSVDAHRYVGIVMGVQAYRSDVSEKTTFVRKNAKAGPEKLLYWYYPDQYLGVKFFSSEGQPTEVAVALARKR